MGIDFTVFKGSASEGIVQATTHREAPTGTQVLVKITHSGICGTDEHFRHADMVLGHEGVGTVQQIGDGVQGFKVGDVVGWGYIHKACGACKQCLAGDDNYCDTPEMFGLSNLDQGSFGSHAIWDASFLFHVPTGVAPEAAAPLMCGGATVFTVLETYGGLGHLAIQFLAKMGAAVVVFSSTDAKRDEALRLGAAEFYLTNGVEELKIGKGLDHLLVTANSIPDWKPFIRIMNPRGSIYPLTISFTDFSLPALPLVTKGLTIQGSTVASRSVLKKMLDFVAFHKIQPIIERFPMTKSGVEEGMAKLRDGKMRYRGVLVAKDVA
ncbi:chaperonin 10-like protein [Mycena sp. CBHHK59/15]|nr:chaperonin 10-like protein [Mycena sp. CBHHK59/15]